MEETAVPEPTEADELATDQAAMEQAFWEAVEGKTTVIEEFEPEIPDQC